MKRRTVWSIVSVLAIAPAAIQAAGPINTGYFGNVAVKGYDVVAYFTEGRAVQGSEAYSTEFSGAEWHFSSAEHRDIFLDDPIRYMPQYGGYCAVGVSAGERSHDIDPEAWEIHNDKLYLNYSQMARDLLSPEIIEAADRNWAANPTDQLD